MADDDQIVPIGASALLSSKLVKGSHGRGDRAPQQHALDADRLVSHRDRGRQR
jgi:hypothetical protein